jgi:hypothetical protein
MEEQVIQALFQCTSSDSATRSTAESFITELKQQPGFHPLLLSISQNPSLPEATKQLASIILKNSLANWKKSSVPNEDKLLIRSALLPCLKKSVTSKIRSQIEEVAQAVGKAEYPWDGINEQLHSFIDSQDPDFIYAALNLIFRISKNFEFVMGEKRNKLFGLVIGFFDKLEVLMARFLNEVDGIALDYVALILQIFWVSFYIELPESVISERMLNSWIGMFVRLMGLNLEASDVTVHPFLQSDLQETKHTNPAAFLLPIQQPIQPNRHEPENRSSLHVDLEHSSVNPSLPSNPASRSPPFSRPNKIKFTKVPKRFSQEPINLTNPTIPLSRFIPSNNLFLNPIRINLHSVQDKPRRGAMAREPN